MSLLSKILACTGIKPSTYLSARSPDNVKFLKDTLATYGGSTIPLQHVRHVNDCLYIHSTNQMPTNALEQIPTCVEIYITLGKREAHTVALSFDTEQQATAVHNTITLLMQMQNVHNFRESGDNTWACIKKY